MYHSQAGGPQVHAINRAKLARHRARSIIDNDVVNMGRIRDNSISSIKIKPNLAETSQRMSLSPKPHALDLVHTESPDDYPINVLSDRESSSVVDNRISDTIQEFKEECSHRESDASNTISAMIKMFSFTGAPRNIVSRQQAYQEKISAEIPL
jgi:hypothetical protein